MGWTTCIRRCRRWKLVWPFSLKATTSPSRTTWWGARAAAMPSNSGKVAVASRPRRLVRTTWPSSTMAMMR